MGEISEYLRKIQEREKLLMNLFYWLRVTYKKIMLKYRSSPSFCKDCGRYVHDFVAPDDVWEKVEPRIKRGYVLCYDCFCEHCDQIGIFPVWRLEKL